MIIKKVFLFLSIVVLTSVILVAQEQSQEVSGIVFLDKNENGQRDSGEKGIPGVLVSNQREVVATDAEGLYSITITPGQTLMVIQPSGYVVPVDENNIPQFSYLHEPEGSPELKYGGIAPTGQLPTAINFPLLPLDKKDTYKAIIFGDPQTRDNRELNYVRDMFIDQGEKEDADFMLVLGDLVFNDMSLYERYKKLLGKTGIPIWSVVGNHDIDVDGQSNRHARDTYKKHFGANYYAFQYGEVTFVTLDNVDFLGRYDAVNPRIQGKIWGDQLTWLSNLLSHIPDNNRIVISSHVPLYTSDGKSRFYNTVNREELFKLLENRDKLIALNGHVHLTYHNYLNEKMGWNGKSPLHQISITTMSGTLWGGPKDHNQIPITTQRDGVPNGYHLFTFEGTSYAEQLVGQKKPKDQQIRIELPNTSILKEDMPDSLVVNVLNGNERNRVWYRLNDGEWKKMEQATRTSPYYEYLLQAFPAQWASDPSLKSFVKAVPTNHIWVSDLTLDAAHSLWKIEVKTTDAYGNEWSEMKVVEIDK